MAKKEKYNDDFHLSEVAKRFLEMGLYEFDTHKELTKTDKGVRFAVGYVVEQSVELNFKQISYNLFGEYPEKHDLVRICDFLTKNINRQGNLKSSFSLTTLATLKRLVMEALENAQTYGNLAYGAKYVPDLEFSYAELEDLIKLAKDVQLFYISNKEELCA